MHGWYVCVICILSRLLVDLYNLFRNSLLMECTLTWCEHPWSRHQVSLPYVHDIIVWFVCLSVTHIRDSLTLCLWSLNSQLLALGTTKGNLQIYNHRNRRWDYRTHVCMHTFVCVGGCVRVLCVRVRVHIKNYCLLCTITYKRCVLYFCKNIKGVCLESNCSDEKPSSGIYLTSPWWI